MSQWEPIFRRLAPTQNSIRDDRLVAVEIRHVLPRPAPRLPLFGPRSAGTAPYLGVPRRSIRQMSTWSRSRLSRRMVAT